MKVNQKSVEGNLVLLDVVASIEEVNKAFDTCSIVFAQQNGLQPEAGKTPAQVAEEKLGIKDLDSIVANNVVEYLVPFAIDKKGLVPAFVPLAKPKSALIRGSEFAFELPVPVKPAYELTSYEPVEITVEKYTEDTEAVDRQIKQMAEQFAEYKDCEPHAIAKGDACSISMKAFMNGQEMTGLSMEKRTYITGEGFMPDGFEEQIIGMNVGETKTFTFDAPSYDEQGELKTEEVECTVTIEAAQEKVIPEINDEWVASFFPMFKTLKELKNDIAHSIDEQRHESYDQYCRGVAAEALVPRFEGKISDEAYEATAAVLSKNMQEQAAAQGITWDKFVEMQGGAQQFNMMLMIQVRQMLVQGYCLDAIYRHEKLKVEDKHIMEACASVNPQNPKAVRMQMEETGRGFALREVAERLCASDYLYKNAKINYVE